MFSLQIQKSRDTVTLYLSPALTMSQRFMTDHLRYYDNRRKMRRTEYTYWVLTNLARIRGAGSLHEVLVLQIYTLMTPNAAISETAYIHESLDRLLECCSHRDWKIAQEETWSICALSWVISSQHLGSWCCSNVAMRSIPGSSRMFSFLTGQTSTDSPTIPNRVSKLDAREMVQFSECDLNPSEAIFLDRDILSCPHEVHLGLVSSPGVQLFL